MRADALHVCVWPCQRARLGNKKDLKGRELLLTDSCRDHSRCGPAFALFCLFVRVVGTRQLMMMVCPSTTILTPEAASLPSTNTSLRLRAEWTDGRAGWHTAPLSRASPPRRRDVRQSVDVDEKAGDKGLFASLYTKSDQALWSPPHAEVGLGNPPRPMRPWMPPELEHTTHGEWGSELSDLPTGQWCQRLGIWCQRTPAGNEVTMGMLLHFDPARRPVGLGVSAPARAGSG